MTTNNTPKSGITLNVGCIDSFIRIFVGLLFFLSALIGILGSWALLGAVLVATGMARYCPVLGLVGLNSFSCNSDSSL